MYAYPVRPTILPEHLRLGSITTLALLALLICLRGLWRGRDRWPWLLAALLGTAFVLFDRWHRYQRYPALPQDTFFRETIAWTNFLSWFLLAVVSIVHVRWHPKSLKVIVGTWSCVGPALLLWMSGCVYPRSAADSNTCRNQMKMIGIAAHSDREIHENRFFPLRFRTDSGVERSWRVELLPFLEASALRNRYHDDATWDSDENASVTNERKTPYRCPANERPTDARGRVWTAYLAATGARAVFEKDGPDVRHLRNVPYGMSNKAMIVEACGQNVIWTEPRDLDIDTVPVGVNLPSAVLGRSEGTFSATHPGGPGVLMVDGSVQTLDPDTDPAVLRAILTVDGNEKRPFD